MPPEPDDENYNPLALIAVVLASLLLFSAFFLGFLVAPLAVLTLFYVVFAASDRSKRGKGGGGEPAEAPVEYDETVHDDLTADERQAQEAAAHRTGTTG